MIDAEALILILKLAAQQAARILRHPPEPLFRGLLGRPLLDVLRPRGLGLLLLLLALIVRCLLGLVAVRVFLAGRLLILRALALTVLRLVRLLVLRLIPLLLRPLRLIAVRLVVAAARAFLVALLVVLIAARLLVRLLLLRDSSPGSP